MFDTVVTVVGNVLTVPEWRRTANTNTMVANFKVASTARRLDKETGAWVDGNSLRVRVNCWRRLAEGVAASVMVGDPVVVVGRLYTRDWTDAEGNSRTMYEVEAMSVGHDLSRGRAHFQRNRPVAGEDRPTTPGVRGVDTARVPLLEDPGSLPPMGPDRFDPAIQVRGGGFGADEGLAGSVTLDHADAQPDGQAAEWALDTSDAEADLGGGQEDRDRDLDGEGATETEAQVRPTRRGRSRVPVSA